MIKLNVAFDSQYFFLFNNIMRKLNPEPNIQTWCTKRETEREQFRMNRWDSGRRAESLLVMCSCWSTSEQGSCCLARENVTCDVRQKRNAGCNRIFFFFTGYAAGVFSFPVSRTNPAVCWDACSVLGGINVPVWRYLSVNTLEQAAVVLCGVSYMPKASWWSHRAHQCFAGCVSEMKVFF